MQVAATEGDQKPKRAAFKIVPCSHFETGIRAPWPLAPCLTIREGGSIRHHIFMYKDRWQGGQLVACFRTTHAYLLRRHVPTLQPLPGGNSTQSTSSTFPFLRAYPSTPSGACYSIHNYWGKQVAEGAPRLFAGPMPHTECSKHSGSGSHTHSVNTPQIPANMFVYGISYYFSIRRQKRYILLNG